MSKLVTWLKALWLLRQPELFKSLGERQRGLEQLAVLRRRFPGARVSNDVHLLAFEEDRIVLADGVTLSEGCILSCGDERNGFGRIEIGAGTWLGQYNNLRAGGGTIKIGEGCLVSQFCTLVASNHATDASAPIQSQGAAPDRRGVTLGDDVWLGAGVAVMPGVSIGKGAVVGANAVVTRDIPAYEIWGGVPARRIGQRQ